MTTAYILDFESGGAAQYDAVVDQMQLGGRMAPGGVFHAAGPYGNGWRVIDVWEDEAAFAAFAETKIGPITAEHGLPEPQIRTFPVTRMMSDLTRGPIGFMQLVQLRGLDEAAFAALDTQIHHGGPPVLPAGAVLHAGGEHEGAYWLIDAWNDRAARDRFMENHVAPVMAQSEGPPPMIEELEVHATLTEPAEVTVS